MYEPYKHDHFQYESLVTQVFMHLYGRHFGQLSLLLLLSTSFSSFFLWMYIAMCTMMLHRNFQTRPHLRQRGLPCENHRFDSFGLGCSLLCLHYHHITTHWRSSIYESEFFCDCGFDIFLSVSFKNNQHKVSSFLYFTLYSHTYWKKTSIFYIYSYVYCKFYFHFSQKKREMDHILQMEWNAKRKQECLFVWLNGLWMFVKLSWGSDATTFFDGSASVHVILSLRIFQRAAWDNI